MNAMLYDEYQGKFCKVIIRTNSGEKSLKGIVSIFDQIITIKGDYQQTSVNISEIIRITTKENTDDTMEVIQK